jgi:hypothetical protein
LRLIYIGLEVVRDNCWAIISLFLKYNINALTFQTKSFFIQANVSNKFPFFPLSFGLNSTEAAQPTPERQPACLPQGAHFSDHLVHLAALQRNAAAAATPWLSRGRLICAASEPELRRDPSTRIRTKVGIPPPPRFFSVLLFLVIDWTWSLIPARQPRSAWWSS